jgi:hypothetical protein
MLEGSWEVGLKENTEKTLCTIMSYHDNAIQLRTLQTANKSYENVARLKYFGAAVKNQNCIREEITSTGKCCCHSLQKALPSCFLSKI